VLVVPLLVASGIGALYWAIGPDSPTARNEFARTVVQILGGGALLTSLYFTARALEVNRQTLELNRQTLQHNFETQQENQRINRETLQLNLKTQEENQQANRDRDVTARFTSAVEQLGSEKLEVCLGAIYALERLSKDSVTDYSTIMELLTAYVRERSRLHKENESEAEWETRRSLPIGIDIQAILTVIRRRGRSFEYGESVGLDLHNSNLTWASLAGANLVGASLAGASLTGASLERAYLDRAKLGGVSLTRAKLGGASLTGAYLAGADLTGADLMWADLTGADLTEAVGLERGQLLLAILSPETKLPPGIEIDLPEAY
jgi:uncharacterized protein YjbI with pentapeptide repeats